MAGFGPRIRHCHLPHVFPHHFLFSVIITKPITITMIIIALLLYPGFGLATFRNYGDLMYYPHGF